MWLIADSGSTKTEWILFDSNEKKKLLTSGLNPLFLSEPEFKTKLKESIPKDWINEVTKLWFYGAGCGTNKIKLSTKRWLKSIFTKSEIQVDSDLMAAARATFGAEKGVVAILGTGSNSCYFDGEKVAKQIKPLGFILGDEGSGAALGRSLLKKMLRQQLNQELTESIQNELGLTYDQIINRVYHSEWPNRFIASCSKLLLTHIDEPAIINIINDEFGLFVSILKEYKMDTPVNFVGSIAYHYKSNLKDVLNQNDLEVGLILKSPADALVEYHLKEG